MSVLVVAEHNQKKLNVSTRATISAANAFNSPIDVWVIGSQCQPVAAEAAKIVGINKVYLIDEERYQHLTAEKLSLLISQQAKNYAAILAPATTFGKNFMPRVAALLDVAQISDVIQIVDEKTFVRPIYAGNALMTVQSHDAIKVMTIRPTAFVPADFGSQTIEIEKIQHNDDQDLLHKIEFIRYDSSQSERPDLTSAAVVVSGGRGLNNKENFKIIEALADCLNAAIGASRAAVDAGFVPNDFQVGQTGKVVAPNLYIAVGISGAIQHIAGMKDSKVIVAINKDPDAPIFQIADYGLVGDLFELVPALIEELKKVEK